MIYENTLNPTAVLFREDQLFGRWVYLLLGLIGLIEMTYQVETKAEQSGTGMSLFGIAFDAATPTPWITSAAILVVGGLLLWAASRRVRASWTAVALVINARRSA